MVRRGGSGVANRLKVGCVHAIEVLLERGWSQRRIAEALGIARGTVARYARLAARQRASDANAAGALRGSASQGGKGSWKGTPDSRPSYRGSTSIPTTVTSSCGWSEPAPLSSRLSMRCIAS